MDGISRRLEKIFRSIATLLGYRMWDRDNGNAENPEVEKEKRSGTGIATDEAAYRVNFAINEAMLFQLLDTIAVICWTTIRLTLEWKISRRKKICRETENKEETLLCDTK